MADTTTATVHVFETAGLGKAPFRLVSVDRGEGCDASGMKKVGEIDGYALLTKHGGTCAYCGTAIKILCKIESADGQRFHVGSDCVEKTDDRGLRTQVRRQVNARRNAARKARDGARIAAAKAAFPAVREALSAQPHPNAYRASQGDTMADWCAFMLKSAGNAGRLRAARVIEAAAGIED